MNLLLIFLLEIYCAFCYGYIFSWALGLYNEGYLKTQQEKNIWLLYYIFAPVIAPFIYGVSLAIS